MSVDQVLKSLSEQVAAHDRLRFGGSGSKAGFLPAFDGPTISAPSGVLSFDKEDQVVEAWAGTSIEELQTELASAGQCLPLSDRSSLLAGIPGTIGGLLAANLPHDLFAQLGSPRDWTLGITLVRADGTSAKSGSKAVKNVAGYDVHNLLIGSRAVSYTHLRAHET